MVTKPLNSITTEQRLANIEASLLASQREVFTFEKAMEYLGIKESTLYGLNSKHKIKYFKPNGKKVYYEKQDLDNYALRNCSKTEEEIEQLAIECLETRGVIK